MDPGHDDRRDQGSDEEASHDDRRHNGTARS